MESTHEHSSNHQASLDQWLVMLASAPGRNGTSNGDGAAAFSPTKKMMCDCYPRSSIALLLLIVVVPAAFKVFDMLMSLFFANIGFLRVQ